MFAEVGSARLIPPAKSEGLLIAADVLIKNLNIGNALTPQDRARLKEAVITTLSHPSHRDVTIPNDPTNDVQFVVDGFACRYKILPDGRRAIVACLLPGDFCDLNSVMLGRADHAVCTMTACTVARIPHATFIELTSASPRIARAFWLASLNNAAITREWLVSMGQRLAAPQLAHLICELFTRLRLLGQVDESSFSFPFTQEELGDALGITSVHVNRVLNQLREDRLISLHGRVMTILDRRRLEGLAGFDGSYLECSPVDLG